MVAANADDYAASRVNIFFPANNNTPADGNLTGQCVTLVKWFLAEMCDGFPSPFAARGDARYVGKNLVAAGLAVEVPYDQRRRGDIICLEYGQYGHIYVQLSGGRVFEENVNWPGTTRRLVDGDYVYSSRIGNDSESWRHDFHAYRLKSYNEGVPIMPIDKNKLTQGIVDLGVATQTGGNPDGSPTQGQIDYWVGRFTGSEDVGTVLGDFGSQVLAARSAAINNTKPDIQKAMASLAISTHSGSGQDGSADQGQIDYWTSRFAIDPTLGPILADFASQVEKSDGNKLMQYQAFDTTSGFPALKEELAAGGGDATVLAPGKYQVK
jgi:hypothetical protein